MQLNVLQIIQLKSIYKDYKYTNCIYSLNKIELVIRDFIYHHF